MKVCEHLDLCALSVRDEGWEELLSLPKNAGAQCLTWGWLCGGEEGAEVLGRSSGVSRHRRALWMPFQPAESDRDGSGSLAFAAAGLRPSAGENVLSGRRCVRGQGGLSFASMWFQALLGHSFC